jgi:acetyl-CoA synthetase
VADESSSDESDFHVRWFADSVLNAAANCLDRHLATRAGQTAILWEPDDPAEPAHAISYAGLHAEVCRFANVLKELGAHRGSRITIYLPMTPEAAVAMLACARQSDALQRRGCVTGKGLNGPLPVLVSRFLGPGHQRPC